MCSFHYGSDFSGYTEVLYHPKTSLRNYTFWQKGKAILRQIDPERPNISCLQNHLFWQKGKAILRQIYPKRPNISCLQNYTFRKKR